MLGGLEYRSIARRLASRLGSALVGFAQSGIGEVATTASAELQSSKTMRAWYVDSSAGSSSYSGRTPNAALSTIAGLLAKSLQPGDTIYLKCGSTWREQLTLPDDRINVESYGDGVAPILDGADTISAASWSAVGGLTNVYGASLATDANGSFDNFASVWENGTRLTQASSAANCDSTAGTYYPQTSIDTSPFTLYIHPTASDNPGTNGKTYEYAKRASCVDAYSVENCTIRGITGKRQLQSKGSISLGKNCVAYDCKADEGNSHNLFARGGAKAYRCTADEAYCLPASVVMFIGFEGAASSEEILFEDCHATLSTNNPTDSQAFFFHTSTGTLSKAILRRCSSTGLDYPWDADDTDEFLVEDCDASDFLVGVQSSVATTIRRGVWSSSRSGMWLGRAGAASITWTVEGLDATVGNTGGGAFADASNNSFVLDIQKSRIDWQSNLFHFAGASGTLTSRGNAFIPNANAARAYWLPGSPTINSDYNNFGGISGISNAPWIVGTKNYFTLEAFQMGETKDTNSSNGRTRQGHEKVALYDTFLGATLDANKWTVASGTDPQCVDFAVTAGQLNGVISGTTGDDGAVDMATNGIQISGGLHWKPSQEAFVFECRMNMGTATSICVFVGITDQNTALEMPFTYSGTTLTSNASNACGVLFDTDADTDNWKLVGVAANADATVQDAGVAPVINTYETWRVEIYPTTGSARFYRNGAPIGTAMASAITSTTVVCPVVAAFARVASSRVINIDFIRVENGRLG